MQDSECFHRKNSLLLQLLSLPMRESTHILLCFLSNPKTAAMDPHHSTLVLYSGRYCLCLSLSVSFLVYWIISTPIQICLNVFCLKSKQPSPNPMLPFTHSTPISVPSAYASSSSPSYIPCATFILSSAISAGLSFPCCSEMVLISRSHSSCRLIPQSSSLPLAAWFSSSWILLERFLWRCIFPHLFLGLFLTIHFFRVLYSWLYFNC